MTTLDLAHSTAEHLGTGWHAYTGKAANGPEAHLAGPNDQVLDVFSGTDLDRTADQGRLIITGHLGSLRSYVPQDFKRDYTITVNNRTPPGLIAREVRRRLLPDYQTALTAARNAKQASDGIAVAREQFAAIVATRLGVQCSDQDTDFDFGTVDEGVHGRVCVRSGACDSRFRVYVPHDRVTEFARLFVTFGRLH
jgi:hypothetical protein